MADPTFHQIMRWTTEEARSYLESIRWSDGPVCPNGCASEVYRFEARTRRKGKEQPVRHLLKCKECKRQFTATVGTIFEDSKIPLNKWLAAIYLMCASKKGISAHQLHRMLGVTYKTAWFMSHRVRYAMKDKGGLLKGIIEADETYVGGKPRGSKKARAGRSMSERIKEAWDKKMPVLGILEREGRVRTVVMKPVSQRGTQATLVDNIDLQDSRLMTDQSPLYFGIRKHLPHFTVEHDREYVTGDGIIHTQGIEGFWSLLKRGLNGTFHHVKPSYLGMYCDEFAFRYNARKLNDGERFASALGNVKGRLSWYVGRQASQDS